MATNLAHIHTNRNTLVHVPVIQYNDKPATSTTSQQWECQTGCNVTDIKLNSNLIATYVICMRKYFHNSNDKQPQVRTDTCPLSFSFYNKLNDFSIDNV